LGLLEFIEKEITFQEKAWSDVTGLVIFKGPGSFTGLRIGVTVFNTLAATNRWPIVGVQGEDWRRQGIARLAASENDELVLPEYGGEAHITKPRK
jgi:tRNA threonylcarbamoyladenosine biosynthesis protein TsaB